MRALKIGKPLPVGVCRFNKMGRDLITKSLYVSSWIVFFLKSVLSLVVPLLGRHPSHLKYLLQIFFSLQCNEDPFFSTRLLILKWPGGPNIPRSCSNPKTLDIFQYIYQSIFLFNFLYFFQEKHRKSLKLLAIPSNIYRAQYL